MYPVYILRTSHTYVVLGEVLINIKEGNEQLIYVSRFKWEVVFKDKVEEEGTSGRLSETVSDERSNSPTGGTSDIWTWSLFRRRGLNL